MLHSKVGIGRVSSDVSHSPTSWKKVSMRLWWIYGWVDSYVSCRWLNCSNFEETSMSVLKVRKYGKLKKDVLKRPCLTLLYKSLLCDLMIFLTPVHIQNKNTALYTWFDFMVIFYFVPVYPTIPKYHSLDPGTWPADGSTSEIILRGARKK